MENKKYAKIRIVSENGQVDMKMDFNSVSDLNLATIMSTEKILNTVWGLNKSSAIKLKAGLLTLVIGDELTPENIEKNKKYFIKKQTGIVKKRGLKYE